MLWLGLTSCDDGVSTGSEIETLKVDDRKDHIAHKVGSYIIIMIFPPSFQPALISDYAPLILCLVSYLKTLPY